LYVPHSPKRDYVKKLKIFERNKHKANMSAEKKQRITKTKAVDPSFVKCKHCDGGFKNIVAEFYGRCPNCDKKQRVTPNPGQERHYDMKKIHRISWNVLDELQQIEIILIRDSKVTAASSHLGYTVNRLADLVRYLNPHKGIPSVYADGDDSDDELDDLMDRLE
jgi:hypothetical protein